MNQDPPSEPTPGREVTPEADDSAESVSSSAQVVRPSSERSQEMRSRVRGVEEEDEDENDENYEPNGDMEESESEGSSSNARRTTYEWQIQNFSDMQAQPTERQYSKTFKCGDYDCRVLLFPRGNATGGNRNSLSIYVEILDIPEEGLHGTFEFKVVNQNNPASSIRKDGTHKFTREENDRGFAKLISFEDLRDEEKSFLVDDTIEIHTTICIKKMSEVPLSEPRALYDSKKETGFVGLKNQGATCYMNSLLQFMFHIPRLREAVYNMPNDEDEKKKKDDKEPIALALQRVFYHLQTSSKSVDTKALTKSFGWSNMDSFMQHDVQEFSRVLCDSLEEKMKGTKVDGMIAELFKGKLENFIECINVDYKSTRVESFYDLSLMVKGCANLHESFKQYVEVETLEGDNQYRAEGHGKQDAEKGCRFISFPPIMHLHLKRFEYDAAQNIMVKVNDSFEFPTQIDVSEFLHDDPTKAEAEAAKAEKENAVAAAAAKRNKSKPRKNGSKPAGPKKGEVQDDKDAGKHALVERAETTLTQEPAVPAVGENLYLLHSVLVHSGSVHGGHYYAYIRPCPRLVTSVTPRVDENGRHVYPDAGKWFQFDDEEVRRVPQKMAVNNNFGGVDDVLPNFQQRRPPFHHRKERTRASSAYMLVYINYKETLYHPRLGELVEKTVEKIAEDCKRREVEERKRRDMEREHQDDVKKMDHEKISKPMQKMEQLAAKKREDLMEEDSDKPMKNTPTSRRKLPAMEAEDRDGKENEEPNTQEKAHPIGPRMAQLEPQIGPQAPSTVGDFKEVKTRAGEGKTIDSENLTLADAGDPQEEKQLADGKGRQPRPGEKRKRRDGDKDNPRRRSRRKIFFTPLETADETNEGADIPVPNHLLTRFKEEEAERRRREAERQRAHLFHQIKLVCETDLAKEKALGTEFFTLREFKGLRYPYKDRERPVQENLEKPPEMKNTYQKMVTTKILKVEKKQTLMEIKETVSEATGIPASDLQYWVYSARENKTRRPNRIVERAKVNQVTTSELCDNSSNQRYREYNRYDIYGRNRKQLHLFVRRRLATDAPAEANEIGHPAVAPSGDNNEFKSTLEGPRNPNPSENPGRPGNEQGMQVETPAQGATPSTSAQGRPAHRVQQPGKLLLFKYFDVEKQRLRYVGSGIFAGTTRFKELYPLLTKMAGLPEDCPLKLYEEEDVDGNQINLCYDDTDLVTFKLLSGDIIVFQKKMITSGEGEQKQDEKKEHDDGIDAPKFHFDDVNEYLKYLGNRIEVIFRSKEEPGRADTTFRLELQRNYTPRDVRCHVAKYLGCHYNYVRISASYNDFSANQGLLKPDDDRTFLKGDGCQIFYEKLSYSVLELKDNYVFEIKWLMPNLELKKLEVLVPKDGKMRDLHGRIVAEAQRKFPASFEALEGDEKKPEERVRIVGVKQGLIKCEPDLDEEVQKYKNQQFAGRFPFVDHLRAEIIDQKEERLEEGDKKVSVFFYHSNPFGTPETEEEGYVPFFFVLKGGETLSQVKARLAEKIKSKRFGGFKLRRIQHPYQNSGNDDIEDDAVLADLDWEDCHLGMEFPTKPRAAYSYYDRPMKISAS